MFFNDGTCRDCGESVSAIAPQIPAERCWKCGQIAQLREERDFNAASLRDANDALARLREERDDAVRQRETIREALTVARSEADGNRGEVARLRAERDEAMNRTITAAVCPGPHGPALPEDAEKRIARACFEWDRACDWSERTDSDEEAYMDQAVYVLAALGVRHD